MKRRIVSLLLAALIFVMAGCGAEKADTPKHTEEAVPNVIVTTEPLEAATEETETQPMGFVGEQVIHTYSDTKVRVVYDPTVVEIAKAETDYPLRLGLAGKRYSENLHIEKSTPQSYYDREKASLEEKAAAPIYDQLNYVPEAKLESDDPTPSVFDMTTTYTDVSMSDLELFPVASGMTVYRFEQKYTRTVLYEKVSGPAEDFPDEVNEAELVKYMVDLGDGYILNIFTFSKNATTLDQELKYEALEKILNSVYIELLEP